MFFRIIRDGNVIVADFDDMEKAIKKFYSVARRGVYVELWSGQFFDSLHVIKFAN